LFAAHVSLTRGGIPSTATLGDATATSGFRGVGDDTEAAETVLKMMKHFEAVHTDP
jgi:hypothetical protein